MPNAQQPTAVTVTGATWLGPNGLYEATTEQHDGRPVFRKFLASDRWLVYYGSNRRWRFVRRTLVVPHLPDAKWSHGSSGDDGKDFSHDEKHEFELQSQDMGLALPQDVATWLGPYYPGYGCPYEDEHERGQDRSCVRVTAVNAEVATCLEGDVANQTSLPIFVLCAGCGRGQGGAHSTEEQS